MTPLNLLSAAEAKIARADEIAPMIDSKVAAMAALCSAFSAEDPGALGTHFGRPEAGDDIAMEAYAWKVLLTFRIEVDESAAAMMKVLSPIFQIHQAAHQQRDLALLQIEKLSKQAHDMIGVYSLKAAQAAEVVKKLLAAQGVELDVPKEMIGTPGLLGANGAPLEA